MSNPGAVQSAVNTWLVDHHDDVIGWRRHLHSHPELSHDEVQTTSFLDATLRGVGLEPVLLPGTGLIVDIGGDPDQPAVAFRADIDALPVTEVTGLEFASKNPGVMHACGHDIHTTVVLALACALAEYDRTEGLDQRVRCIFQPAEEVLDGGATDVIRAGALQGVSHIFAVHAEPKLRAGQVGVRAGAITSATDVVEIIVKGPGGHTSRPHLTADAIYAAGLLITGLPGLLSRRVDPRTGTVLTFGAVNGGAAFNAMPQEVSLLGTLRTGSPLVWRQLGDLFPELVEQLLVPTGATAEIRHTKGVPPVTNDDACTALMAQAVKDMDPHALQEAPQSSGGEDFSWYLEHVPGSMARLGAWNGQGEKADLHQADIIFDEACLPVGVRLFAGVLEQFRNLG
ncbi:amidohydrolase [Corynebacterium variabile]|uniref:N-acyl-L-amino acid amidohydrolase n=1 Tax=Corynebacterium variabile TaxID=1727 RepID=A0A4Y4C1M7_9CORY|nr:amidohydrolase [Corynebacterium variabile]MDN6242274.1 amidohydrolase [Corynebacterium variabile]MDN6479093.1 amidohydrolase [Corynebacterium variabile]MDN6537397.1 amidohydrolase [Corynebacterium variabile]MDN6662834.1 amidohydrolase [Corynebacterium variabile]MDN6677991.1 amidohydrolase [Corynebacterium variabile]